ncbi:EamA/RhaT family transporter [Candidatus Woesearchaeota archaeon]|nr:EamA/RhaT family transporter [Candidatus Woesearchaeota archaeon]
MATKLWAALLVLFTTLLTSSAQILWKKGVATLAFDILGIITNYYIIGGILLYVVGGALLIISFRGGEVSVLYPIIAMSYIWVSLLSVRFLGEIMNPFKWIGVAAIIAGIACIGYGSKGSLPGAV